jgi:hypothetical protein
METRRKRVLLRETCSGIYVTLNLDELFNRYSRLNKNGLIGNIKL